MSRPDLSDVLGRARADGLTIATAESFTGGALCRALVAVPGASDVVHGGVVVYSAAMKKTVLGVDEALIDAHGVVSDEVAQAMAVRVRALMGTDVGVATTGVAGPGEHDGKPPGRVHLAVSMGDEVTVRRFQFEGDRAAVIDQACAAAAEMLAHAVAGEARDS